MSLRRLGREALLFGVGAILAAIAGGLAMDYVIMPLVIRHGMQIKVPDISGRIPAEALKSLSQLRLKLRVEEERWSPGVPEGHIISQRPGSATGVKEGRTVYVTVSRGDRLYAVPDLTSGMSLREARFRVEQAGLMVGQVEEVPSEAHPGVVVGQHPEPGTETARGAAVALRVSRGPAIPFPVPNLVGVNVDSVFAILERLDLSVGHIDHREQPGVDADTVLEQKPEAGAEIHAGDAIDLIVSE